MIRGKTRARTFIALIAALPILCGCVIERQTDTARTATEELLISAATDRAAEEIGRKMPPGGAKIFLETSDFDALDGKYALGSIRDALLRHGNALVDKKEAADLVVEVRSGALSIDNRETLVGIPSYTVPIPLAGQINLPKIAFYDDTTLQGVAKFAATGTDAKTGSMVLSSAPQYGYAHKSKHTVLLFISWISDDLIPDAQKDP